jgi:diketogulonate reductase-like aldo/keto reductase
MPRLGLGTYKTPEGFAVESAVMAALECGYRHIDTASLYGNEEGIGRALLASGVPREELFVATKVWNDEQGYRGTIDALESSLARLQTDYLDLYLVHWPIPELMADTWRAMQAELRAGRVRAIGVCNHQEHHLRELLAMADIAPSVNQVEFHFRLQQPDLVEFCTAHGITVEAWAPLMRGGVADIEAVREIAADHDVTPFQVAVRWVLQRGVVAIPKSVHSERIIANADVYGFELSPDEMASLDALDAGDRIGRHPDTFADPATRPVIQRP